jgi:hypothetical protein
MSRKCALIIGNSEYSEPRLTKLATPVQDVNGLADVFRLPDIGGFDDVTVLVNETESTLRRAIVRFLAGKHKDDLLLSYFSGHGILDEQGSLFLAAKDTELDILSGSAIPASFIRQEMDRSRSRRQVLILDCCYSGAFYRGVKSGPRNDVSISTTFDVTGYGRVVITATNATQYAWEEDKITGYEGNSLLTHFMIRGLQTGDADINSDGLITTDELFNYTYSEVIKVTPNQTPSMYVDQQTGQLVIARNSRSLLSGDLQNMLQSTDALVRLNATRDLERLLKREDSALALVAYKALERLIDDDSRRVSELAKQILTANSPDAMRLRNPASVAPESRPVASSQRQEDEGLFIPNIEYLDFELEIASGSGREYPLSVIHSPAGEARDLMIFPFDELTLSNRLQALRIALLRSGGSRRLFLSTEEQTIQDFGRELFTALITGEIRSRYDVSLRESVNQNKGLRIKLRFQTPAMAALPWEFLYDPRQAEHICLSINTPVVRYLEMQQSPQALAIKPPLNILCMVVSPRDLPHLEVEKERERIENALKNLQTKGVVNLTWMKGQTWRDLQRVVRTGVWHVFHFIGHGGFDRQSDEGLIVLADDNGNAHRFGAIELARLLADHRSLRLVVLNSCEGATGSENDIFSSTASILLRRGLSAVLAMQYEITDRAAIEFARTFYESLSDGFPVDTCVTEARKSISLSVANSVEWGTPVLYMRAPDGKLFSIAR